MDIQIQELIQEELQRQRQGIELIASENFASLEVIQTMGSVLNNKYAEGYPNKRYYGGCEVVDKAEQLAINRLNALFSASYSNVQPHSGAQANMAVFLALLQPGDQILGLDLAHGGHLSHGSPVNFSGKYFKVSSYGVRKDDGRIDMEDVYAKAINSKPKLIICGASAYSRDWDYAGFQKIADEVGATLLADIAHPAGLIAKGLLNDPLSHCDIVTSTTHKTLRGPRGGIIMMRNDFENKVNKLNKKGERILMSQLLQSAVFPGTQGGPLEHIIAAKAVAFKEALEDSFTEYGQQIIKNAQAMATAFLDSGFALASGGTDNHLMLVDLRNKQITGKDAEQLLIRADITTNKNMIPNDPQPATTTSGIRVGTPAITTRGLKEKDCVQIVEWINDLIIHRDNDTRIAEIRKSINSYMDHFPLYPTLG